MIGNDIVDLNLAKTQSTWRRRGYLQKIFSKEEQKHILNSENKDRMVWLFWSMKEAAYKAWQRKNDMPPRFNPLSFKCFINSLNSARATGQVLINKETVITESLLSSRYIHSIGTYWPEKNIVWKSFSSKENLTQNFLSEFAATKADFSRLPELKKNKHFIPELNISGKTLSVHFSFSHHGSFSGFAFPVK